MLRVALSRRWVGGLVIAICSAIVCTLLGRWQWDRSQSAGGDLQNLAYSFNWWLFAILSLGVWGKALRDEGHRLEDPAAEPAGAEGVARRQLPPSVAMAAAPAAGVDLEVDEWNAWLAELGSRPHR